MCDDPRNTCHLVYYSPIAYGPPYWRDPLLGVITQSDVVCAPPAAYPGTSQLGLRLQRVKK